MIRPVQTPAAGTPLRKYRGDILSIQLTIPAPLHGQAWLRTNIGRAQVRRNEILDYVHNDRPVLDKDWHDIPMEPVDAVTFRASVPLLQTGCFEAKCLFIADAGGEQMWPEGGNSVIKVDPAEYCAANSIYSVFTRQFGSNKELRVSDKQHSHTLETLDKQGYTVIPGSGTFRDVARELDFIVGELGFNIIQLLPVHPTPTTYARMGRFGSPFASLDFMDVDPSYAEFDRQTTPMQQFEELINAVHARRAKIFIDLPVNHTGWASALQTHHPEWFARNNDSSFQSPGAWGVTWEDLSRLDYSQKKLWQHMAEVFLFWCRKGVDGFRCDAGYMIPLPVWEYITARVRTEFPDTVMLLEGLGGKISVTENLVTKGGLNWAYSELFQNYDRNQIQHYLPSCMHSSENRGIMVHFAETHDNNRLAAASQQYSEMRTALSALFSTDGAFGITNGVEWFATEKVDVHGDSALNWNNPENQVARIARLNTILNTLPCYSSNTKTELINQNEFNAVCMLRSRTEPEIDKVLAAVNLDTGRHAVITWRKDQFDPGLTPRDLLSGKTLSLNDRGENISCDLEPGQAICLSTDSDRWIAAIEREIQTPVRPSPFIRKQRAQAKALEISSFLYPGTVPSESELNTLSRQLIENPDNFFSEITDIRPLPLTRWNVEKDRFRTALHPAGNFILIRSERRFSVNISRDNRTVRREHSFDAGDKLHYAVITPLADESHGRIDIEVTSFQPTHTVQFKADILQVSSMESATVRRKFSRQDIRDNDVYTLCTNGTGAMSQVRAEWGTLKSQYDAILAANLNSSYPVDRQVMLSRYRVWLVNVGYSYEINIDCLRSFETISNSKSRWVFDVPCGMGLSVPVEFCLELKEGRNSSALTVKRLKGDNTEETLPHGTPVKIIVRPDIDDRCSHCVTKAYTGQDSYWPSVIKAAEDGFTFTPEAGRALQLSVSAGTFTQESEWNYMVHLPFDSERGVNGSTDIFSPGFFSSAIRDNSSFTITAQISGYDSDTEVSEQAKETPPSAQAAPADILKERISAFMVKRDDCKTVIAGYPWFLDWGRDTLIALRGIIDAGFIEESKEILRQFAIFEKEGTIPNMIRGNDDNNRDTSDAPLWFFTACRDLTKVEGMKPVLEMDCKGRSLKDVLISIADNYIKGTSNGIKMDPETGLIFSPSHFTWMDTNYPAGTPREGYPIEIQALWFAALNFLFEATEEPKWLTLSSHVSASITELYTLEEGYLSDCLHTDGGPARSAVQDNALRPNQLFAITLGAVTDSKTMTAIIDACNELLIPGAIRSLADRPVKIPLPVSWQGTPLNDPDAPYWGRYTGDEDTRRKPAYHNGTAWSWPFPSYPEALYIAYGENGRKTASAILSSYTEVLNKSCAAHIPEVIDGNAPHIQRGCGAQAWGITELYRVMSILA